MSLETKGTIKFDPDVKPSDPQYIIQVKQLGIVATGSGDIEQMMHELTERTRREMSEQFGILDCSVSLVKYTISCVFDVSAPVNCTLDQFEGATVTHGTKDDEVIVQFAGHKPIKIDQEKLELAKKTLEVSKKLGIPPDTLIEMAKKKTKENGAAL